MRVRVCETIVGNDKECVVRRLERTDGANILRKLGNVLFTFDVASIVEDISILYPLCSVVQSIGRQSI